MIELRFVGFTNGELRAWVISFEMLCQSVFGTIVLGMLRTSIRSAEGHVWAATLACPATAVVMIRYHYRSVMSREK